jgi:glycosyltransferase involved in cell wall biosynthesis
VIYLVCPFSRPRMARRVWENFSCQTHPCELVVVENGPAVSFFKNCALPGVTVLHSAPSGIAEARNTGLHYVQEQDGDYLALDDDDWYGPDYVAEWARNRHKADVVSKFPHYAKMTDGQFYLYHPEKADQLSTEEILGSTIGIRARDALDFTELVYLDDHEWSLAMFARGATSYRTGISGYAYDRSEGPADHTNPHPTMFGRRPHAGPFSQMVALGR